MAQRTCVVSTPLCVRTRASAEMSLRKCECVCVHVHAVTDVRTAIDAGDVCANRALQFPHEVVAAVCDALDEYVHFCTAVTEAARREEVATIFEGPVEVVDAHMAASGPGAGPKCRPSHSRFGTSEETGVPRLGGLLKFAVQLTRLMTTSRSSQRRLLTAYQRQERRELRTWLIRALCRAVNKLCPAFCPEYHNLLQCVNTIGSDHWHHASLFVRLICRSWKPADSCKLQLLLQLLCQLVMHLSRRISEGLVSSPPLAGSERQLTNKPRPETPDGRVSSSTSFSSHPHPASTAPRLSNEGTTKASSRGGANREHDHAIITTGRPRASSGTEETLLLRRKSGSRRLVRRARGTPSVSPTAQAVKVQPARTTCEMHPQLRVPDKPKETLQTLVVRRRSGLCGLWMSAPRCIRVCALVHVGVHVRCFLLHRMLLSKWPRSV